MGDLGDLGLDDRCSDGHTPQGHGRQLLGTQAGAGPQVSPPKFLSYNKHRSCYQRYFLRKLSGRQRSEGPMINALDAVCITEPSDKAREELQTWRHTKPGAPSLTEHKQHTTQLSRNRETRKGSKWNTLRRRWEGSMSARAGVLVWPQVLRRP